jgi:hypothetical protein
MNTKPSELAFGLRHEIPEASPAGWGARAIQYGIAGVKPGWLDFLHDRQDGFARDEKTMRMFLDMLNAMKINQAINKLCVAEYRKGNLQPSTGGLVVLENEKLFNEDGPLVVKADTKGSCGYVYLCAYLLPSDDMSGVVTAADESYSFEDKDALKWSGKFPVPSVGDQLTSGNKQLGTCTVVRLANYHNWVHAWVWSPRKRLFTNFAGVECQPASARKRSGNAASATA